MEPEEVSIHTVTIRLDALLKFSGLAGSGGEAKMLVQSGHVRVNGGRETHRGRQLHAGDVVELTDARGNVRAAVRVSGTAPPEASPDVP